MHTTKPDFKRRESLLCSLIKLVNIDTFMTPFLYRVQHSSFTYHAT
jgi:hypothetical protein